MQARKRPLQVDDVNEAQEVVLRVDNEALNDLGVPLVWAVCEVIVEFENRWSGKLSM